MPATIRLLSCRGQAGLKDQPMSLSPSRPILMVDPRPHPALPGADWADQYGIEVRGSLSPREALNEMLARSPGWIAGLLSLRNQIVSPLGLKGARLQVGEGGFPVVAEGPEELILGLNDRHLDFRLVLNTRPAGHGCTFVSLATLVAPHNLGGRTYLAAILPFHRLIVSQMLSTLYR